jgi:glucosylglycerate synthase
LASNRSSLGLQELFQQIVSSAFETIELHAKVWTSRSDTQDLPIVGALPHDSAPAPPVRDGSHWRESLSHDAKDLADVLRAILTPTTFAAVEAAAESNGPEVGLSVQLWAAIVCDFLVAYHQSVMRRDHIAQALLPLYRARTGTFLSEYARGAGKSVDIALESLCVEFERHKGRIVERWTSAG